MALKSFIEVDPESHFPIQNLPYCIFKPGPSSQARPGVAIGDYILDLSQISSANLFTSPALQNSDCFHQPTLNKFIQLGPLAWTQARSTLQQLLSSDEPTLRDNPALRKQALLPFSESQQLLLPISIPNYTDFFSSLHHAQNCTTLFSGPAATLHPNWFTIPLAYHGRASSIVVSGTAITRPMGVTGSPKEFSMESHQTSPCFFGPSEKLDFELEVGAVVGVGNELGERVGVEEAGERIFGFVLMNDWSARDIQRWESAPLGPFLGKSFGTSISPWIVTEEALRPFKCAAPVQVPATAAWYLDEKERRWGYDVSLEVAVRPGGGAEEEGGRSCVVCRSNMKNMYWSFSQQLAHHTVNGCNLRVGDVLGSGTISGEEEGSFGSLLELSWDGRNPIHLGGGGGEDCGSRRFLEDGDEVVISGWCRGDGYVVGFGECRGTVLPSPF